jgi:hypothetical protein
MGGWPSSRPSVHSFEINSFDKASVEIFKKVLTFRFGLV